MAITIQASSTAADYKTINQLVTAYDIPRASVEVGDWIIIALAADANVVLTSIQLKDSAGDGVNLLNRSIVDTATNAGNVVTSVIIAEIDALPEGIGDLGVKATGLTQGEAKAMAVYVVRGLAAPPTDKHATATGSGTTQSSGATAVLSQADELVIGAIGTEHKSSEAAGAWTAGAAYVSGNEQTDGTAANGSAANITIRSAAEIVSSTDAQEAEITNEDDCDWAAVIATFKAPSGPTVHYGSATITGVGDLDAAAWLNVFATAAISGGGDLSSSSYLIIPSAAQISGAGTLEAIGVRGVLGAAEISGSGALSAAGLNIAVATAQISGDGALSGTAMLIIPATATITGDGALSAASLLIIPAGLTMTGQGALSASGGILITGAAELSGAGALSAVGVRGVLGTATATGTGDLSGTALLVIPAAASMSGAGDLSATALLQILAAAAMSGTGDLSAAAWLQILAAAELSGAGDLTAIGEVIGGGGVVYGEAVISGQGDLSGSAWLTIPATAALSGQGTLTADGLRILFGAAQLAGTGALSATGIREVLAAAQMAGLGDLTAAGSCIVLAVAQLDGAGALSSMSYLVIPAGATLSGLGALTADGVRIPIEPPSSERIFTIPWDMRGMAAGDGRTSKPAQVRIYVIGHQNRSTEGD